MTQQLDTMSPPRDFSTRGWLAALSDAHHVKALDDHTREKLSEIHRLLATGALQYATPGARIVEQCGGDVQGECEQFRRSDWRYEVSCDSTVLGYWDWVAHRAEAEGVAVEQLSVRDRALEAQRG